MVKKIYNGGEVVNVCQSRPLLFHKKDSTEVSALTRTQKKT